MYNTRVNRQQELFERNCVGYFSAITMFQSKGFNLKSSELSSKQLLLCCWNSALKRHNRLVVEVKIPIIFTIEQLIFNNNVRYKWYEIIKKKLRPRSVCFKLNFYKK